MKDEKFTEKPDHGHYDACRKRMYHINALSNTIFWFTLAACAFMICFTLFGVKLSVISYIPSLAGDQYSAGFVIIQFIEIILLAAIAVLGRFMSKLLDVIIFLVYFAMCTLTLTEGFQNSELPPFLIGLAGCIVTFRSVGAYLDYKQLSETEGFPHFNIRVSDPDAINYQAQYEMEYYNSVRGAEANMPHADKGIDQPAFNGSKGEMLELDFDSIPDGK